MAASDARPVPRKGVAYRLSIDLRDSSGALVPGATGLDSEISKDGGGYIDCTNELTEIGAASGTYYLDLTSTETNADAVALLLKGTGVQTRTVFLYPEEIGDYRINNATLVDEVWDEVLTGVTHNVVNSAGRKLRALASTIIIEGTAVSATDNSITLDSAASSNNGAYDPGVIAIVLGTGAGQSRLILEYVGATKKAIVDRNWKTVPDATSEYVIYAGEGREHVNEGLSQGGTASTIILNANASSYDHEYEGQVVFIRSGTGEDQARRITHYDGTTKTAYVYGDWSVVPDATSGYVMLPSGVISFQMIGDAILAAIVEGTLTIQDSLKLTLSALTGKVSGAPLGPIAFRDTSDTKNRIVANVDTDGNRTVVVRDVT